MENVQAKMVYKTNLEGAKSRAALRGISSDRATEPILQTPTRHGAKNNTNTNTARCITGSRVRDTTATALAAAMYCGCCFQFSSDQRIL